MPPLPLRGQPFTHAALGEGGGACLAAHVVPWWTDICPACLLVILRGALPKKEE